MITFVQPNSRLLVAKVPACASLHAQSATKLHLPFHGSGATTEELFHNVLIQHCETNLATPDTVRVHPLDNRDVGQQRR